MFCPRCAHQQASNEMRFCSRCGLSLGLVTDLVTNSSEQLKREKRELTGIALIMATVLMLINFIIVFGAVTLPHLGNSVFLWLWLGFVSTSLVIGGLGLANLIRGGFFKRLKERELRLNLLKAEQASQMLKEKSESDNRNAGLFPPSESSPRSLDQPSVTETTTRELQAHIDPAN